MSDGFFAEYAIVDARLCAKLSDKMSFKEVCLDIHQL
jgi:NADPH:quinone reductase-like Zn-dependent oxidoreductase